MIFRTAASATALWVLLFSSGCGGPSTAALHGKVTLDGVPVTSGSIAFFPEGAGTKAAAAIVDGNYTIEAEDGLQPGKYRVEVSWHKPTGRKVPSADPGITMDETKEAIPAKYNTASTLTAELDPGEASKDFALTSQ
jgi:hypothetical protein